MNGETRSNISFAEFELDTEHRQLRRDGKPLPLYAKTFDLLAFLIQKNGHVVTKDEILDAVWEGQIVEESNLSVQISALRKVLGERKNEPRFLVTVPGKGYKFVADVNGKGHGGEIVIERHQFSRVVVDDTETSGGRSDVQISAANDGQKIAKASRTKKTMIFVGSMTALALVGLAGIWFVRWRSDLTRQPVLHRFTTQGGLPFRASISPDGKSLAYIQRLNEKLSLWVGTIETNSSVPVYQESDLLAVNPAFSPDSSSIYFVIKGDMRSHSVIVRRPVLGGAITELIEDVAGSPTFSPDGKQLAFIRNAGETRQSSIIIADTADGKNERTLVTRGVPTNFSSTALSWSPDGRYIAFGSHKPDGGEEVMLANAEDGTTKVLPARDWSNVDNLAWFANGSQLAVLGKETVGERRRDIWLVSYPDGGERKLTDDMNTFLQPPLSISRDGKLAVLQGQVNADIWTAPGAGTKDARRILHGVAPRYEGIDGFSWTPDNKILYTAYVGDSRVIWAMNGDGTDPQQVTPGRRDISDSDLSATPDGRYIVFQSNRSGSFEIWRIDRDGTKLRRLTSDGENRTPSLSPDGHWIVYVSAQNGKTSLARMTIDGTDNESITDESCQWPAVSPDGTLIACYARDRLSGSGIAVLPFGGGHRTRFFPISGDLGGRLLMRWAPDSKAIIYKIESGFFRQGINERQPELIKDFADVPVRNFAWSEDGKNFAYVTGSPTQEIIVMENVE